MKPLTLQLSDDVYDRAERRASDRGASLPGEVAELVKRYGAGDQDSGTNGSHQGAANGDGEQVDLNKVLHELAAVAEECRLPNWDGYGAAAVSADTLGHACRLVRALPSGCPWPSVGVEPDGHLTLEWHRQPRWTLSVSVSPEADMYFAALFEANDVRGRERLEAQVPEIILSLIRRVFAR